MTASSLSIISYGIVPISLCVCAGCVSLSASLTEMTAARSCWNGAHEWLLPMADLQTPSDIDA